MRHATGLRCARPLAAANLTDVMLCDARSMLLPSARARLQALKQDSRLAKLTLFRNGSEAR